MKRPVLFGLSLSLLAFNAFAMPAEDEPTPMVQPASSTLSQPLNPIAEDGAQRTLDQQNRVAEDGYDRTKGSTFVAEDGYDRTKGSTFVAEGGADRLAERNQRAS